MRMRPMSSRYRTQDGMDIPTDVDGTAMAGTGIAGLTATGLSLDGSGIGLMLVGATGTIDLGALHVTGASLAGVEIDSSSAAIAFHDLVGRRRRDRRNRRCR